MKGTLIMLIFAAVAVATTQPQNVEAHEFPVLGADSTKTDVVCGMKVKSPFVHKRLFKDKEYAFCSKSCKTKFDQKPEKYTKK